MEELFGQVIHLDTNNTDSCNYHGEDCYGDCCDHCSDTPCVDRVCITLARKTTNGTLVVPFLPFCLRYLLS